MPKQNYEVIKNAVREAASEAANQAYYQSQRVVPVKTGFLRSTGNITEDSDSITIRYSAPYASVVERGWNGGLVWTDSYRRLDGVFVKGHYKNQPRREPRRFIEDSLRMYFTQVSGTMTPFQEILLRKLKNRYKVVKII